MIRTLLAFGLMTSAASAQMGRPSRPDPVVPVNTFSVQGADVATLTGILGDQFPGITFSGDQTSSTIFARVDGADAERVQNLIDEVSIRAVEANHRREKIKKEQQLKELHVDRQVGLSAVTDQRPDVETQLLSFQLRHINPDEAADVLTRLAYDEKAAVAVAGSNLLVRASAAALEDISEVLRQIDMPSRTSRQAEMLRERVVELRPDSELPLSVEGLLDDVEEDANKNQREMELLQMQAEELAQEFRANENEDQFNDLMRALHENLSKQFHRKLQQDRREMEQIRRRLNQISERLEMQERLADRIIERRIQELLAVPDDQQSSQVKKQPAELQILGMMEAELEKLDALKQQQGVEFQDQLADRRAELELSYLELRRRLFPAEFTEIRTEVESEEAMEENESDNDASDAKERPVSDDSERQ